jgi:hypothetical protein
MRTKQPGGWATKRRSRTTYFGSGHPLADVAAAHCSTHLALRLGDVACGACWERAVRDDERLVVECGLPREIEADPEYVDAVAVDRACRGERVPLTRADFRAAVARLHQCGVPLSRVSRLLNSSYAAVVAALPQRSDTVRAA